MFAIPDAIKICEKALSEAQDKIEEMNEDDFKESKELIELLKENIHNWMKKQKADTGNNSEKDAN